jgi:hypothetical protein
MAGLPMAGAGSGIEPKPNALRQYPLKLGEVPRVSPRFSYVSSP